MIETYANTVRFIPFKTIITGMLGIMEYGSVAIFIENVCENIVLFMPLGCATYFYIGKEG